METRKQSPREAYKVDGIYEFRVRKQFPTYCEVIDESTDITTYLRGTANLKLFKGQTVKLLSKRELTWNTKEFIRLLLTEENEKSFESQCHRWIQNLINKKIDLNTVRMDCSDILELSELLDLCSDAEREYYQERLTTVIEQLGYYVKAAELIANEADKSSTDTPTYFINALFNKLQISGFVYHPTKNFNILASLFLRRPELMNSRIKELLDIICQRNIDSWKKEPFNSAIIKLLELYIRECDGRIDKTKDNLELIKNNMQALALQLLLHQNPSES